MRARTATARARTVLVAVGAAATLALATAACGSGGDTDDGPIDGAAHGSGDPADSDTDGEDGDDPADGAPEPADGAPEFDFPDDVEILVDEDTTGDETVDEILRDHAYALLAMRESYAHAEPTENFNRYWTGGGKALVEGNLQTYQDEGRAITGNSRFYNREVREHSEEQARLTFCEDVTQLYDRDSSGEVQETEPSPDDYRSYVTFMSPSEDGGWQIKDITGQAGSDTCQQAAS